MSLHKRCSRRAPSVLTSGEPNPLHCEKSPRCEHYWHYDFRVNGRRYRASTETADKHQARDIEAAERTRILEGRHGIRRQPDVTFREFAAEYLKTHSVPNKKPSTLKRDRQMLAAVLLPVFGACLLRDITASGSNSTKRSGWPAAAVLAPSTVN